MLGRKRPVREWVIRWELKKAVEAEKKGGGRKGRESVKLHLAAFEGNVEEGVRFVKEKGADLNAMAPKEKFKIAKPETGTLLHYAVETRKMNAIRALLDAGADPKARAGEGRSVLERSKLVDGSIWEDIA